MKRKKIRLAYRQRQAKEEEKKKEGSRKIRYIAKKRHGEIRRSTYKQLINQQFNASTRDRQLISRTLISTILTSSQKFHMLGKKKKTARTPKVWWQGRLTPRLWRIYWRHRGNKLDVTYGYRKKELTISANIIFSPNLSSFFFFILFYIHSFTVISRTWTVRTQWLPSKTRETSALTNNW